MEDVKINDNLRIYNLNNVYIKKLFKLKKTDKKSMCEDIGITSNTLSLKLTGRTLIYIPQALTIAKHLKMDIMDIFCPTKETMFSVLYENVIPVKEIEYRDFEFNTVYIKYMIKSQNKTLQDICNKWNLKLVSIYDKLACRTKMTVQEGLALSELLGIDCNTLYCPSKEMLLKIISEEFNKEYTKNLGDNAFIIKDIKGYKMILDKFDISNLVQKQQDSIKQILEQKGFEVKDLAEKWKISVSHAYNKINGDSKIEFIQALILCNWLDEPMETFFLEG